MRWIRVAPVTAETLMLCVAIFVSCSLQSSLNHERFEDVQRDWGAICPLELVESHDGVHRVKELELSGPFDVWDGDWWRIPVTVFHHADLFQLALNLGAAWYLGRRLERCWGGLGMCLFLIPAICLPVMAELCLGHAVIGFSGVICAMLGALVVLRHFDDKLAEAFPVESAEIGMAAIVLCWLAMLAELSDFANAAHVTGFVYGGLIAWVIGGPWKHVVLLRVAVILAHLGLVPGLLRVTHPDWVGRYHWHQAVSTRSPMNYETLVQYEKSLERATRCDPSLIGAWLRWSQMFEMGGDLPKAWARLVSGLALNPSSAPLMESTRRLWRHLDARQRRDAEVVLIRVFGKRSDRWLHAIRSGASHSERDSNEEVRKMSQAMDVSKFSLQQKLELPRLDVLHAQPNQQDPMGPVDGNDAVEGETL